MISYNQQYKLNNLFIQQVWEADGSAMTQCSAAADAQWQMQLSRTLQPNVCWTVVGYYILQYSRLPHSIILHARLRQSM